MSWLDLFRPHSPKGLYGLVAEYDNPDALLAASRVVKDAGYRNTDALTPFPIHGMEDALGIPESRVGKIAIFFSFTGATIALLLIWWTGAVDYPLVVGGKPFFAFEPSIPITFELTVLFSAFSSVIIMLFLNGLPRWNHPVFNAKTFPRVGDDRFLLVVERADPKFDLEATRKLLESTHPLSTEVVEA
jgi:hypothetical protein